MTKSFKLSQGMKNKIVDEMNSRINFSSVDGEKFSRPIGSAIQRLQDSLTSPTIAIRNHFSDSYISIESGDSGKGSVARKRNAVVQLFNSNGLDMESKASSLVTKIGNTTQIVDGMGKTVLLEVVSQIRARLSKAFWNLNYSRLSLCPICYGSDDGGSSAASRVEDGVDNEEKWILLPCSHGGHVGCIRAAIENNPKCPYCRADCSVAQLADCETVNPAKLFKELRECFSAVDGEHAEEKLKELHTVQEWLKRKSEEIEKICRGRKKIVQEFEAELYGIIIDSEEMEVEEEAGQMLMINHDTGSDDVFGDVLQRVGQERNGSSSSSSAAA